MGDSFLEDAENQVGFMRIKSKQVDKSENIFKYVNSAGWQSRKLAQLTSTFDFVMNLLHWDISVQMDEKGKPYLVEGIGASLTKIIKVNQATIGAKYHNDYVKVALAEETVEQKSRVGIAGSNVSKITGQ